MPKDEWGVKRVCPSCNERFYDLQADPMTCPNCSNSFTLESLRSDRPRALEKAKPAGKQNEDDLLEEDDVLDDGDDLSVDDDLLEEDEEDNVSLDDLADVPAEDEDS